MLVLVIGIVAGFVLGCLYKYTKFAEMKDIIECHEMALQALIEDITKGVKNNDKLKHTCKSCTRDSEI